MTRGKLERFARSNRALDTKLRQREAERLRDEVDAVRLHAKARKDLREAKKDLRRESKPYRFLRGAAEGFRSAGKGFENAKKVLNRVESNNREWFGASHDVGLKSTMPGLGSSQKEKKKQNPSVTVKVVTLKE